MKPENSGSFLKKHWRKIAVASVLVASIAGYKFTERAFKTQVLPPVTESKGTLENTIQRGTQAENPNSRDEEMLKRDRQFNLEGSIALIYENGAQRLSGATEQVGVEFPNIPKDKKIVFMVHGNNSAGDVGSDMQAKLISQEKDTVVVLIQLPGHGTTDYNHNLPESRSLGIKEAKYLVPAVKHIIESHGRELVLASTSMGFNVAANTLSILHQLGVDISGIKIFTEAPMFTSNAGIEKRVADKYEDMKIIGDVLNFIFKFYIQDWDLENAKELHKSFGLEEPRSYDDYLNKIWEALTSVVIRVYMSSKDTKLKTDVVEEFVKLLKAKGADIELELLDPKIFHSRWAQINSEEFKKKFKEFRHKVMLLSMLEEIRMAAWKDHPWFDPKLA